jgi:hypothetical protein
MTVVAGDGYRRRDEEWLPVVTGDDMGSVQLHPIEPYLPQSAGVWYWFIPDLSRQRRKPELFEPRGDGIFVLHPRQNFMVTGDLQMKKTSSKNESADIDDFRMLLKEQVGGYFSDGDGQDNLKVIVRGIVRDEIYGNEPGEYKGDASVASRKLIRELIREELYAGDGK